MTGKTFIILVNYNNHDDTLKCLGSIARAGYGKNVVVVDNKSTTPGLDNIKIQFPDTILIMNDENIGFGRANNIGIQWALMNTNCEYLFILNNDTTINETTISMLEMTLSGNGNIAIATPKIVMMDNPDVLWYGGGDVDWRKGSARVPGLGGKSTAPFAIKKRSVTFASGCAMLIRTEIIRSLGGFDPRYFMYEEDLELSLRVVSANYQICYTPASLVFHKGQGSLRTTETEFQRKLSSNNPQLPFYTFHTFRNRLLTMNIHAKGSRLIIFHLFFWPIFLYKILVYARFWRWDGIAGCLKGVMSARKAKSICPDTLKGSKN